MFTGIIQAVAPVKRSQIRNGSLYLTIEKPRGRKLKPGDSIATNGACLTVKEVRPRYYVTELMPETLRVTSFGAQVPGAVNLERPLTLRSLVAGHLVLGHVDAVGEIKTISGVIARKPEGCRPATAGSSTLAGRDNPLNPRTNLALRQGDLSSPPWAGPRDDAVYYTFTFPKKFSPLVVRKGSIAIDGISLTVVDCGSGWCRAALVPYTLEHTTLGQKLVGELANIEFDILGKYLARMYPRTSALSSA